MSVTTTDGEPNGPVAQSLRVGVGVLQAAVLLLAAGWLLSNIRPVPPDKQAVVLRFGQVVRVQQAGLVLAWPRPAERVVLLPGPEQQLGFGVNAGTARQPGIEDAASAAGGDTVPESAGAYLTGDGGAVLLDAALTYRVANAAAYYLAAGHVAPALRRLFMASAAAVAAGGRLEDFMAVGQARIGSLSGAAQAGREALRGALAREMNRRLGELEQQGAGLGVEVTRVDVAAALPPAARTAFVAVLEAAQMADQGIAAARTDAERVHQGADRDRDRVIAEAHAAAEERLGDARARTAPVLALEQQADPATRPSLLDQAYRDRIAAVLRVAGSVTAVDPQGGRVILPGTPITPAGALPR
jgi:regulator of protease activity HflC (stomatin/prohibitin superfamily)